MLRRRLMLFLGSVLTLLLLLSILSIWLLQGVLGRMDHAIDQDGLILGHAGAMTESITDIEIELRRIQLGQSRHLDRLLDLVNTLNEQTSRFGEEYPLAISDARPYYTSITQFLATFDDHVAALATVENESLARTHTAEAIAASISLRRQILAMSALMRRHTAAEEHAAVLYFRWIVFGIALGFLLVINASSVVLYRVGAMVTAPVETLAEASRRLSREEFAVRVPVSPGQKDEFHELATAFNQLAAQLEASEERKLETLAQTAIMLNHELNNASAIIRLQLQLLRRQTGDNPPSPAFERALCQISQSLERMTSTVDSLKRVRRIVLTDYSPDTKMLDLEKSTTDQ